MEDVSPLHIISNVKVLLAVTQLAIVSDFEFLLLFDRQLWFYPSSGNENVPSESSQLKCSAHNSDTSVYESGRIACL